MTGCFKIRHITKQSAHDHAARLRQMDRKKGSRGSTASPYFCKDCQGTSATPRLGDNMEGAAERSANRLESGDSGVTAGGSTPPPSAILPSDLRIDSYVSGPHASVRIVHIPSGVVVSGEGKSQFRVREGLLKALQEILEGTVHGVQSASKADGPAQAGRGSIPLPSARYESTPSPYDPAGVAEWLRRKR